MNQKEFGRYIGILRETNGFESQRQLALVAGVSPSTILRIEDGTQRATPETLKKLAPHLGVPYQVLFEKADYTRRDDSIELQWPEGVKVLRRAHEKLSSSERQRMLRLINAFVEEAENEAKKGKK